MRFTVQPPLVLFFGEQDTADSQFIALPIGTHWIRAFTANNNTRRMEGSSIEELALVAEDAPLTRGQTSMFDECGAWLAAVEGEGELLRGWYHAEEKCDYNIGQTHKSVAYVESTDGGLTFQKVGYPDNQLLTGTTVPALGAMTGAGDPTVLRWRGDYWMYFINWDPNSDWNAPT